MIEIKRTHDMELVRRILTNEKIYHHMADDGSPRREEFRPVDSPNLYYLIPYYIGNIEPLGSTLFHPINTILYQCHIGLLPKYWGKNTPKIAIAALDWMKKNTPCQRVMTITPASNRLAQTLAKRCGFEQEGYLKNGVLRSGALEDIVILGRLL